MGTDKGWAKRVVSTVTGRDLEELLRDLYVTQRATQQEIANSLGVSRDTVVRWLHEYQITRDERPPVSIEGAP